MGGGAWQPSTRCWGHRIRRTCGSPLSHDWHDVLSRISSLGFPSRDENPDGHLWISRAIIPRLMDAGVPVNVIDRMMIDNPKRYLEGAQPSD